MCKSATALVGVFFIAVCTSLLAADEPAKKEEKTVSVKGEIVDLRCYMQDGSHGKDHKECAASCIKSGSPVGLVDEKGDVYLLMEQKKDQQKPIRDLCVEKAAETVTVEGTLVQRGGAKVLFVSSLK